jgi:hypothetical protein
MCCVTFHTQKLCNITNTELILLTDAYYVILGILDEVKSNDLCTDHIHPSIHLSICDFTLYI